MTKLVMEVPIFPALNYDQCIHFITFLFSMLDQVTLMVVSKSRFENELFTFSQRTKFI